jgi:outer membrane lipoprotein-sorting protein
MGSDLFYYDMEDKNFNDFNYTFITEETYENMSCYVIDMFAKDPNAPYSKQRVWINKTDYFIYKSECYDKKNTSEVIKRIVFLEVKEIQGILIPKKTVVDNIKENHKTLLIQENLKINTGIKDDVFTIQNLMK